MFWRNVPHSVFRVEKILSGFDTEVTGRRTWVVRNVVNQN
jgi:hypothetical protein